VYTVLPSNLPNPLGDGYRVRVDSRRESTRDESVELGVVEAVEWQDEPSRVSRRPF